MDSFDKNYVDMENGILGNADKISKNPKQQ
jgi:hypothetical protein